MVVNLRACHLYVQADYELVINQVMKESTCRVEKMKAYYEEVRKLEERFDGIKLHHILRCENAEVDALTKLASTQGWPPPSVFLDSLDAPSIRLNGEARPSHCLAATMNALAGQAKGDPLKATTGLIAGQLAQEGEVLMVTTRSCRATASLTSMPGTPPTQLRAETGRAKHQPYP